MKTHEPKPMSITVKELGIKGWLKGERILMNQLRIDCPRFSN
jgi:hypothetical protein